MNFEVNTKRFKLIQTKQQAFNTDTILLSNYIKIPKVCKNILDVGTGSGVLMLDLAFKTDANIKGVEIQKNRYDQAVSNIELNGFEERLKVINSDFRSTIFPVFFDVVVSNPPFFKVFNGRQLSENQEDLIARHEVKLELEDLIKNVSRVLKYRGYFYMIHRPNRLNEIINYCTKYNLEVKTIRFVHPYVDSDANHILIMAIKNGGAGLIVEKPLILYESKHNFTEEMKEIIGDF